METAEQEKTLEQRFYELAQELYQGFGRRIQPKYPWILVRVLPKEQMVGSIILPDVKEANKILYEGIVLETWRPFTRLKSRKHDESCSGCNCDAEIAIEMKSIVQPGDHVLFPHYEGLPVPFLPEKQYRIIRETNPQDPEGRCELFAKLEYSRPTVDEKLQEMIMDAVAGAGVVTRQEEQQLLKRIKDEFYVVSKNASTLTVTGE